MDTGMDRATATLSDRVQRLSTLDALAVSLCARSQQHNAGTGTHDAARYGACSLHEQMATETLPLVPTDLFARLEWAVRVEGRAVLQGEDEEAALRLLSSDDGASLLCRVALSSRAEGHLLDSPWMEHTS